MKFRLLTGCWIGCLLIVLSGCTMKAVDTADTGDSATAEKRVLIASQNSKFKRALVSEIKDTLQTNAYFIRVIDVKKLNAESVSDYNAIVVINRCMAGRPDPRVETFIDNAFPKHRIIVLTTGRLDSWKPEAKGVDAMTSASNLNESSIIAQRIVSRVLAFD